MFVFPFCAPVACAAAKRRSGLRVVGWLRIVCDRKMRANLVQCKLRKSQLPCLACVFPLGIGPERPSAERRKFEHSTSRALVCVDLFSPMHPVLQEPCVRISKAPSTVSEPCCPVHAGLQRAGWRTAASAWSRGWPLSAGSFGCPQRHRMHTGSDADSTRELICIDWNPISGAPVQYSSSATVVPDFRELIGTK